MRNVIEKCERKYIAVHKQFTRNDVVCGFLYVKLHVLTTTFQPISGPWDSDDTANRVVQNWAIGKEYISNSVISSKET